MPLCETLAFAVGAWAFKDKDTKLKQYVIKGAVVALALHGSIAFLIDSLILHTRVLAHGAPPMLTIIVIGFVFPLILVFVRKEGIHKLVEAHSWEKHKEDARRR